MFSLSADVMTLIGGRSQAGYTASAMSDRSLFLGKLIGLYELCAALCMLARKQAMILTVSAIVHDQSLMFVVGWITLAAGLALVLAHNVWSRRPFPVVVTLVGWTTLLKGLLFLLLAPAAAAELFLDRLHYQQLFYLYAAIALILGVYLTCVGFMSGAARTKRGPP